MKEVAIIFRRKKMKTNYKLIPIGYIPGTINKEKKTFEPNTNFLEAAKNLKGTQSEYPFANDINQINKEYVYGLPVSFPEIIQLVGDDDTEYLQMFLEEYLEVLNNYHYYQEINDENELFNYTVLKQIKEYESIDMEKPYESAIKEYMDMYFDEKPKTTSVSSNTELKEKDDTDSNENLNVKKLYNSVVSSVIGQDYQVQEIISAIDINQRITNPRLKQNILVCGPTGCGKTEIFRLISKNLQLPMVVEDATQYTIAGYVGKSIDDMLCHLLINANNDLNLAQKGILVVDEIDKKAGGTSDEKVATTGVLESLLKLMEGGTYNFEFQRGRTIPFETTNLTFVALGAFSGLKQIANPKPQIGFGNIENEEKSIYSTDSFNKFGLLPEFIGRMNNKVIMNPLTEDILIQILLKSDNSPLLLCHELFKEYNVSLEYNDDLIEAIAKEAIKLETGARSLFEIIFKMTHKARFEIQCERKYKKLILTKETIKDNTKYTLK